MKSHDPAMRPAFERWLKQVAPHGHERDHWHVWQAAWGARDPLPGSLDLQGAASFIDELIGEDCDDSIRALVRKTILGAALPPTLNKRCESILQLWDAPKTRLDFKDSYRRPGLLEDAGSIPAAGRDQRLVEEGSSTLPPAALPRAVQGGAVRAALEELLAHWEKIPMWNAREVNASVERARAALSPNTGDGGSSDTRSECSSPTEITPHKQEK